MKFLKWTTLALVTALLAWRIIVVNLSAHYSGLETAPAASIALGWEPDNPDALLLRALASRDSDPVKARELLLRGIEAQPSNGRMLSTLGRLHEAGGNVDDATHAMRFAQRLAPRASAVQADLAGFWAQRDQPERYFKHLVEVIDLRGDLFQTLHPALLEFVETPAYSDIVRQTLSKHLSHHIPRWWRGFFAFASINASELDSLRLLYSIRLQSEFPMSSVEVKAFSNRLERDGEWLDAYFLWLNSLEPAELELLGNIYNGGFERRLSNQGFGWRTPGQQQLRISVAETTGATGKHALRINFPITPIERVSLRQFLLLPPGRYELSGRVRVDGLRKGLAARWNLRCVTAAASALAETAPVGGRENWRTFSSHFEVPRQQCSAQLLYFVVEGPTKLTSGAGGTMWFDDLTIRTVEVE